MNKTLAKNLSLYFMAIAYTIAGIIHFTNPEPYLKIMPPYLPAHELLVQLSGFAEILLGLSLMIPRTRVLAAWGVIALLIAVFPANVYMLQVGGEAFNIPQWVLIARLPVQGLLIAWAYIYTRKNSA
jgi:uncharacterized membrane protein